MRLDRGDSDEDRSVETVSRRRGASASSGAVFGTGSISEVVELRRPAELISHCDTICCDWSTHTCDTIPPIQAHENPLVDLHGSTISINQFRASANKVLSVVLRTNSSDFLYLHYLQNTCCCK